jgi:hypothetical protein
MNRKQQSTTKFLLVVGIIVSVINIPLPIQGLHKETALLKKSDKLEDIVNGIKNDKVNFKKYRNDDGISPTVMKDSQIYKEADKNVQDCIDFAGKIRNNLGDREIVHCFDDSNYYKNKNFNANHTSF